VKIYQIQVRENKINVILSLLSKIINLKEGIILTSDQENLRNVGEVTIIIKPVWK